MDTTINCIIADDEPLARLVLEKYVTMIPQLNLLKSCKNAFEVIEITRTKNVDLFFLDIKMPELSGLQLIKNINLNAKVIFTTAFSEFAVDAFELEAVDYLLKPIAFERFLKAVKKAFKELPIEIRGDENLSKKVNEFIFLRADRTFHKVFLKDLIRIEAYGNFIKVFTTDQMLVVAEKISKLEETLPPEQFIRVHKSHIISFGFIKGVRTNELQLLDAVIPIGQNYKMRIAEWFEENKASI